MSEVVAKKKVLTMGDVAKACYVAPRTATKWFDNGKLNGWIIPGSKDRRVTLESLVQFMTENNMPTDSLFDFGYATRGEKPVVKNKVMILDKTQDRVLRDKLAELSIHADQYTEPFLFACNASAHQDTLKVVNIDLMSEQSVKDTLAHWDNVVIASERLTKNQLNVNFSEFEKLIAYPFDANNIAESIV